MCGPLKSLDLFTGIFNLLLDVCVVVMPMPVVWGLKMNMSKKICLTGIFGMGIGYDVLFYSSQPFRNI